MIDLYTREDCILCIDAKALFLDNNIPYNEYVIGKDLTREELYEKFPSLSNQKRMLPVIIDPHNTIKDNIKLKSLLNNILET